MAKLIDETGNRYGRLVVLSRAENYKNGSARWLCQCDCGRQTARRGGDLRTGNVHSCGCPRKLGQGKASFNDLFRKYKHRAKKKGLEWELTEQQFYMLTQQSCYMCGALPTQVKTGPGYNGAYIYNGLDRLDNTKGYSHDNVAPCCKVCNRAKQTMSYDEFVGWLRKAYEHVVVGTG